MAWSKAKCSCMVCGKVEYNWIVWDQLDGMGKAECSWMVRGNAECGWMRWGMAECSGWCGVRQNKVRWDGVRQNVVDGLR